MRSPPWTSRSRLGVLLRLGTRSNSLSTDGDLDLLREAERERERERDRRGERERDRDLLPILEFVVNGS